MVEKLVKLFGGGFYLAFFSLVLISAIILRYYKLDSFATFLGDQGRDAIAMKRILTFEHFPAIGPVTSVGQVYLGPFYYYFMAPWLLFFGFDPIGPAFGIAFLSIAFLILQFFMVKDLFDSKTALVSCALTGFSAVMIDFSRYSWNPNLLPYFSFFAVYLIVKTVQENKLIYPLLLGAVLSLSIQLHYLALFLLPITGVVVIFYFFNRRLVFFDAIRRLVVFTVSFVIFFSPLIFFEFRHDFLNTRSFIVFFSSSNNVSENLLQSAAHSLLFFNSYMFLNEFGKFFSFVVLSALFFVTVFNYKKHQPAAILSFATLMLFIGISLYSGPKYPHYFTPVYVLFIVFLSYFLSHVFSFRFGWFLIVVFLAVFTLQQNKKYIFFKDTGSYQIKKAKTISRFIYDNTTESKYVITALPESYGDSVYRYFLEVWGRRPIDLESKKTGEELFVVCDKPCRPIGNPLWIIANFAPNKIVLTKQIEDTTVYKLTR